MASCDFVSIAPVPLLCATMVLLNIFCLFVTIFVCISLFRSYLWQMCSFWKQGRNLPYWHICYELFVQLWCLGPFDFSLTEILYSFYLRKRRRTLICVPLLSSAYTWWDPQVQIWTYCTLCIIQVCEKLITSDSIKEDDIYMYHIGLTVRWILWLFVKK